MTIDSSPEGTLPPETPPPTPQPAAALPPPPAPPPPPRQRGVVLPLLLGVVLGAGAAAGGYVFNEQTRARAPDASAAQAAAVQRLDAAVAAAGAERQRLAADLAEVQVHLGNFAGYVGALEGDHVGHEELWALEDKLTELTQRVDAARVPAPQHPAAADAGAVNVVTTRLNEVAAAVADLRTSLAAVQARPAADPAAVAAAAAGAGEARTQADALGRQVAVLQARVQELEARERAPDPAAARAGMVVAATQLRERLARPGSFEAELAAFRAMAAGANDAALTAALAQIEPYAERGVPSLDELRRRFDRDAAAALAAAAGDPNGWTDTVVRGLRGLVRVRRTGEDEPDTDAGRAARAERLLNQNDVAGALVAVELLTPAAREQMAGWTTDARARVAADAAAATISNRAIALVAQP